MTDTGTVTARLSCAQLFRGFPCSYLYTHGTESRPMTPLRLASFSFRALPYVRIVSSSSFFVSTMLAATRSEGEERRGEGEGQSREDDSIVQFRDYKFDTLSLIQHWPKYIS